MLAVPSSKDGVEWILHSVEISGIDLVRTYCRQTRAPGAGTLGISGWGCAAGTLEPLTYTRASSAKLCYPILE